jgi:dCTP deaminase
MTTLSKMELIKRIMIGEMLINPNDKKSIQECLLTAGKGADEIEDSFKAYFKTVSSDVNTVNKRKDLIKDYVKKNFVKKKVSEIMTKIGKDLKEQFESEFTQIGDIPAPILVDCLDSNALRPANLDLTLGNEVYVTTDKVPTKLDTMGKDGVVSVKPGEFGILMTHEYLFVPWDLMGYISIRLAHKQKGMVNISGFHVDPGYYGRLMFAIFNAGPNNVPLRYNDPVFMIMFNELTKVPLDAKAVQEGRWHGMENIPVETLSGLAGTSVSVRSLDQRIKRLEMIYPAIASGIAAVVIAVIVWILTHW